MLIREGRGCSNKGGTVKRNNSAALGQGPGPPPQSKFIQNNVFELFYFSPGCSLEGLMLKLKLQHFGHLMRRADSLEKTLMLGGIGGRRGRDCGQEEKGMTEDEIAGWHHRLDGREFE